MGATTSKNDAPFETLDADQVRNVVAGFSTFAPRPPSPPLATSRLPQGGDGDDFMSAPGDNYISVCPASSLPHHSQPFFLQVELDILPYGRRL